MNSYGPILYTRALSFECARIVRAFRERGVDFETKDVLVSRRNRGELQQLLDGQVRVPCLVLSDAVLTEPDAILRYLRLRYGN